ncbi:MAG: biotin/lipoyl-binding protein [Theionarchaea archaeon]|nr:biotin/lipoyl-binding protein [Theionarchaea archaeon]
MVMVNVIVDGTSYSAEVENYKVILNGREYTIEDKGDTIEVDGTPYKVELTAEEAVINGIPHTLVRESPAKKDQKKKAKAAGAVTAMMPGKIVAVKVKEGDSVKEGDVTCILEAMKMENELKAPKSGTVKKVHVQAGTNVEKGDNLIEIE